MGRIVRKAKGIVIWRPSSAGARPATCVQGSAPSAAGRDAPANSRQSSWRADATAEGGRTRAPRRRARFGKTASRACPRSAPCTPGSYRTIIRGTRTSTSSSGSSIEARNPIGIEACATSRRRAACSSWPAARRIRANPLRLRAIRTARCIRAQQAAVRALRTFERRCFILDVDRAGSLASGIPFPSSRSAHSRRCILRRQSCLAKRHEPPADPLLSDLDDIVARS